jgi:hypothetical protein
MTNAESDEATASALAVFDIIDFTLGVWLCAGGTLHLRRPAQPWEGGRATVAALWASSLIQLV